MKMKRNRIAIISSSLLLLVFCFAPFATAYDTAFNTFPDPFMETTSTPSTPSTPSSASDPTPTPEPEPSIPSASSTSPDEEKKKQEEEQRQAAEEEYKRQAEQARADAQAARIAAQSSKQTAPLADTTPSVDVTSSEPQESSTISLPEASDDEVSLPRVFASATDVSVDNNNKLFGMIAWACIGLGILIILVVLFSSRWNSGGSVGRKRYPSIGGKKKKRLLSDKYYRNIKRK